MKHIRLSYWIGKIVLMSLLLAACNLPVSGITADTAAPVISNLTTSSEGVYYNDSSCGPTTLTISMSVGDDSGMIQSAGVQYRYNDFGQSGTPSDSWRTLNLSHNGGGSFSGTVDVAAEARVVLNGAGGALEYQAFAIDTAGNVKTLPGQVTYSLIVQSCESGVAGPPPAADISGSPVSPPPPSANSPTAIASSSGNPGAAPTTSPSTGGSSPPGNNNPPASNNPPGNSNPPANNNPPAGNNPPANNPPAGNNSLPPAITLPDIRYFTAPASVNLNDGFLVEWDVRDACRVTLNSNDVNHTDAEGFFSDIVGERIFRLAAWGTPCDDSTLVEVVVTTQVVDPNASSNGIINPDDNTIDPGLVGGGDGTVVLDPNAMATPTPQIISGFVTLNDGESVDLGDGGADVTANMAASELVGVGGILLVFDASGYADCQTLVDASGVSVKTAIIQNARICYKTGSGNYGDLYIYYVDPYGAYIEFAYDTAIAP